MSLLPPSGLSQICSFWHWLLPPSSMFKEPLWLYWAHPGNPESFPCCCLFLISYLCIFWLCWVFVAACGLCLVVAVGATLCCTGRLRLLCGGFSCFWAQALGAWAFVVGGLRAPEHMGFSSCGAQACGFFLDQGLNPFPLHWQVDSAPEWKVPFPRFKVR